MQGAGVNHRLNAVIAKDPFDDRAIRYRADDAGRRTCDHIQADDAMAGVSQPGREKASEPSRGTRQQNTHAVPGYGFSATFLATGYQKAFAIAALASC